MIVIHGIAPYGRIEECVTARGSAWVQTQFGHLTFVPLIPSRSEVCTADHEGIPGPTFEISLDARSVLAGYLRVLPPVVVALRFLVTTGDHGVPLAAGTMAAWILGGLALWVYGLFVIGRLSARERARRRIYERYAGHPVDVGQLEARRDKLREATRDVIATRVAGLASGYRDRLDPSRDWAAIALDPRNHDRELLGAALTLARIEASALPVWRRREAQRVFEAIWRRIEDTDATPGAARGAGEASAHDHP